MWVTPEFLASTPIETWGEIPPLFEVMAPRDATHVRFDRALIVPPEYFNEDPPAPGLQRVIIYGYAD